MDNGISRMSHMIAEIVLKISALHFCKTEEKELKK
jgi:hypothetical protein